MIYLRKNTKLRFTRYIILILIIALVLSSLWVLADIRLRSVAKTFAKSSVKTILSDCANSAVYTALENIEVSYNDLAVISRNDQGLATSVEINAIAANSLKSYLTSEISKSLSKYGEVTFKVPISAAFGIYYTSFNFPKLSYTVSVTTTVISNIKSTFTGAGINQVLHQILMTVTLESDLAMLKDNTEQTFSTDFIIAQTVIVGAVPEAFTSVGHATDEVMEDIFDFGAEPEN